MKPLVIVGVGLGVIGLGAAVAFAASKSASRATHVDGPVALPDSAIKAAPELGLGHCSIQTDSHNVRWVVCVFPDTGKTDTVITIAALETPVGPWVRFEQNSKTGVRTFQQLDTAGQPVDQASMRAAWGV